MAREAVSAEPSWLWSWNGVCIGYRLGNSLFAADGLEVGRFSGSDVYGADGRYLGELTASEEGTRLVTSVYKKLHTMPGLVPTLERPVQAASGSFRSGSPVLRPRRIPSPQTEIDDGRPPIEVRATRRAALCHGTISARQLIRIGFII